MTKIDQIKNSNHPFFISFKINSLLNHLRSCSCRGVLKKFINLIINKPIKDVLLYRSFNSNWLSFD